MAISYTEHERITDLSFTSGYDFAASTDGNGNVLFGGGNSAAVDKYTPSGTRSTLTDLSVARSHLAASTDGNGNVLFGGGFAGSDRAAVDKYTPRGTRSTLTNLSVARYGLAASTDGDGNVLFGGGYASSYSAAVDKYTSPIAVYIPAYSKYKLPGDSTENTTINGTTVEIAQSGEGYFYRMTNVSI